MHLIYHINRMQLYTILSACNYISYYHQANLYPFIPMQIYTLLTSRHDKPLFPSAPYIYYLPYLPQNDKTVQYMVRFMVSKFGQPSLTQN